MKPEIGETKLAVEQLQLGMFVSRLDRPWEETSFMFQGFIIERPEQLRRLAEECTYVFVQYRRSRTSPAQAVTAGMLPGRSSKSRPPRRTLLQRLFNKSPSGSSRSRSPARVSYHNELALHEELGHASAAYQFGKQTTQMMMDGLRMGRALNLEHCRETVNGVVDSILRNDSAMLWLAKLRDRHEQTAEHCMNVCILSVAFGRHLGLPREEIFQLGMCALLHDVGKAKIPQEVLHKRGPLTDEEKQLLRQHTQFGRDLLMAAGDELQSAVDVAMSHHERVDAKGYPRQLKLYQLSPYARIVALTDAYDAITSDFYKDSESSMKALDIIYKNRGTQFDDDLAVEFIRCIGVYPPGSLVEMTSGEVGIVIASDPAGKLKPKILLVLDADKKPCKERVLYLSKLPTDSQQQPLTIAHELPNGRYGVDVKSYLDKGLLLKTLRKEKDD